MNATGRNAPCPCGSGRKYKQCCLLRAAAADSTSDYTRAERVAALDAVGDFASRREFEADAEAAQEVFFGPTADVSGADASDVLDDSMPFFECWFLFDFPLQAGGTAVELYLRREGARIRAGERRYLERARGATLRPYEVAAVRQGEGLDLVDLWTGNRMQVRERLGSEQIAAWDVIAARLMDGGDGVPVIEGPIYLYPQTLREPMLKELKLAHRRLKRTQPGLDDRDFFRQMAHAFHALWLAHVRVRPLPRLVTPEGDPIVLARVVFDVRDRAALRAALEAGRDLSRQDDGSYVWLADKGEKSARNLGVVVLQRNRLVFEVISRSRAERGRTMVEALAGVAVSYRATSFEDVDQAIARERERPPRRTPSSEVPPEVQAELIGQFLEQHYAGWLDTPLPALDGRTPREAAALKSARPKLISLLKHMESSSDRDRRAGKPAYDFGWMWAELGLARPQ